MAKKKNLKNEDFATKKDEMVSKEISSLKGEERKKGIAKLREKLHAKQALARSAKQPRI